MSVSCYKSYPALLSLYMLAISIIAVHTHNYSNPCTLLPYGFDFIDSGLPFLKPGEEREEHIQILKLHSTA